jgi:tetratricopeptide (TPR) repeat protein
MSIKTAAATYNSFIRMKNDAVQRLTSLLPAIPLGKPKHVIMFDAGNYLMKTRQYYDAIEKYKSVLMEMKYGKEKTQFSEEEIDELLIPLFTNLAACALEVKEYQKTLFYCQEGLQLRPGQRRILYLQSAANIQVGSYKAAMKFYKGR